MSGSSKKEHGEKDPSAGNEIILGVCYKSSMHKLLIDICWSRPRTRDMLGLVPTKPKGGS